MLREEHRYVQFTELLRDVLPCVFTIQSVPISDVLSHLTFKCCTLYVPANRLSVSNKAVQFYNPLLPFVTVS
jgi:hypothetical protein